MLFLCLMSWRINILNCFSWFLSTYRRYPSESFQYPALKIFLSEITDSYHLRLLWNVIPQFQNPSALIWIWRENKEDEKDIWMSSFRKLLCLKNLMSNQFWSCSRFEIGFFMRSFSCLLIILLNRYWAVSEICSWYMLVSLLFVCFISTV